jgi:O-antigen/teichoic acid export membrane protein
MKWLKSNLWHHHEAKRLALDSGWVLGAKILLAVSGILGNALLARMLSAKEMGIYFLAFSIASFGATIGSLGLNKACVRFIAETVSLGEVSKTRSVIRKVLSIGLLGTLFVGGLYFFFGDLLLEKFFHSSVPPIVTLVIACWIVALALQHIVSEAFRGLRAINLASIFGGTASGTLVVIGLVSMYRLIENSTLVMVLILVVTSSFLSLLVAGILLKRTVSALPGSSIQAEMKFSELMNVSLTMLLTNITFFALAHSDIWIIGAFMSQEDVAVYGAAGRLVAFLAAPLLIVNAVVQPMIAGMFVQGKKSELERILRATATVIGIPTMFVVTAFWVWGGEILVLVYGDYYIRSANVMAVLCAGQLVSVSAGSCGLVLYMTGHHTIALITTVVTGAVTVLLSLILVGRYGMLGVAFATVFGQVVLNIIDSLLCVMIVGVKPYMSLSLNTFFRKAS